MSGRFRQRRRRGVVTTADMGCRTPGKRGFTSEEALRRNLSRDLETSGITAYRCPCGYWHASTRKAKLALGLMTVYSSEHDNGTTKG